MKTFFRSALATFVLFSLGCGGAVGSPLPEEQTGSPEMPAPKEPAPAMHEAAECHADSDCPEWDQDDLEQPTTWCGVDRQCHTSPRFPDREDAGGQ
jgi:hypothetical protein